jgi:hypothetical protein
MVHRCSSICRTQSDCGRQGGGGGGGGVEGGDKAKGGAEAENWKFLKILKMHLTI